MRQFTAMKTFIVHKGKVLLLREASTYAEGANLGKYDAVGGRVDPGEHFIDSLKRHVKHETQITDFIIGRPFCVNEWRPVVNGVQFHIVATFFICYVQDPTIVLSDHHDDYIWIDPLNYREYNVIEGSLPAFEAYNALVEK